MELKRVYLTINGVTKSILFDPEKDTLAETLRRYGYLGVKA